MYIKVSGVHYPCVGVPTLTGDPLRFYLPSGGPEVVTGAMTLCTDDGFVLREIDTEGYARREMEGDTLVLTNLPRPEPVPDPEPVEPPMDELTMTQLAVVELAQTVEDNNTANQLAIAELAEAILGGST